ncbi:hypothetical protein EVAR_81699_1 [Eumeta japonica]|uniref:Uncharacterized protein n=1 Tax=Eumeta variegata TaxID=151549 RepID=A0A4C1V3P8_EUMVA|nr:hypothetical protein EVAR_81699_1 [Eumeta japonica]
MLRLVKRRTRTGRGSEGQSSNRNTDYLSVQRTRAQGLRGRRALLATPPGPCWRAPRHLLEGSLASTIGCQSILHTKAYVD